MNDIFLAGLLLALVLFAGRYFFRRFNNHPLVIWVFVLVLVIVLAILILFPTLWLH